MTSITNSAFKKRLIIILDHYFKHNNMGKFSIVSIVLFIAIFLTSTESQEMTNITCLACVKDCSADGGGNRCLVYQNGRGLQ